MLNFENFKNSALIIAPREYHKSLLDKKMELTTFKDIKIITIEEFLKLYFFDYNEETLVYLTQNHGFKYSLAKLYLKNLYYVDLINDKKIDFLKDLKNELNSKNLLIKDFLFKESLKSKDIYVYGYFHFPNFYKNILKPYNPTYVKEENNIYEHLIYEFENVQDEVEAIIYSMIELYKKGIPFKNMKLINATKEVENTVKRMFNFYNIPIQFKPDSIYSTPIVQFFLDNLTNDIDTTLKLVEEKFYLKKDENQKIYNQIIKLLNKYAFVKDYSKVKECLSEEFKLIKKDTPILSDFVSTSTINDMVNDDDYYFIMGLGQNVLPSFKKDDDFFSDELKSKIELETAKEYNEKETLKVVSLIQSKPNVFISYHKKDTYFEYFLSNVNEKWHYQVVPYEKVSNIHYSKASDELKLAVFLDDYYKFGKINKELSFLYNNIKIDYRGYKNDFTKIDSSFLKEKINPLKLSYTSLNAYYKCPFRFYCNHILKLDKYETSFDAFVGSVFHNVLSKAFLKENKLSVDELYKNAIEEEKQALEDKSPIEFTSANEAFLTFLKDDINFVVNTIKETLKNTSLDNAYFEKKVVITKEKDITVIFNGFIDKVLFKKEGNIVYLAIIDYKTGNEEIEIKNAKFGLNLQLPTYLYLANYIDEFKDEKLVVTGFYLQKILNKDSHKTYNKTYDDLKKDALKLEGYSNSDAPILKRLDPNYTTSKLIKGMRVKSDGTFYSTVKNLNNHKIDELINYVDLMIEKASDNIIGGNFEIKPKRILNKVVGCEFCPYKEICFREEKDIDTVILPDNLDFLGGE